MNSEYRKTAKIFKALCDENRLKIMRFVYEKQCKCEDNQPSCQNDACIKDLSEVLNITAPTISHHIKELVNAGLVITQKEGRWIYCKINRNTIDYVHSFLGEFLNTDDCLCKTENGKDTL